MLRVKCIARGGVLVKYDVIESYRTFLSARLRPQTIRMYTERLATLLDGQNSVATLENLNIDKMIEKLARLKYKNEFSQYKNALLYFVDFQNITLSKEQLGKIEMLGTQKKKKYRKLKRVDFKKVDETIKHIKNKKLKLSYQVLLATGLRVFELSQITKNDCTLLDNEITFKFVGKGGKQQQTKVFKSDDMKLYNNLIALLESTKKSNKVFYSANYLQQKAKNYGFQCHDLRRACAKIEYKKTKSKDKVQQKLRHSSKKTTDIYLKSKVNLK